jgi:hypothetical protein
MRRSLLIQTTDCTSTNNHTSCQNLLLVLQISHYGLPLEVITDYSLSSVNPASNDVMSAVEELWSVLEVLFIKVPAIFVDQQVFNKEEAGILHLKRKSG